MPQQTNLSETRLTRASVIGLSDDDFFWALMEPAWNDSNVGTAGQQLLARVTYFLRDAENGGLAQALWNRDAAEVAQVIADLERIGAEDQAVTVAEAERVLFPDMPSPASLDERRALLDRHELEWWAEQLAPFDARLAEETALWPHFRRYLEAHPAEFFRD